MTTTHHVLRLSGGALKLSITEAPDAIYMSMSGAKAAEHELPKLKEFFWPLVDQYRDDPRRMEISGDHASYTAHIKPGPGFWYAYREPHGGEAA